MEQIKRAASLAVEICYALPNEQIILRLDVPAGTTLMEAVLQSGIPQRYPQLNLSQARIGIFGKLRAPGDAVEPGDRVEIYRELCADPKDARRQRARSARRKAS